MSFCFVSYVDVASHLGTHIRHTYTHPTPYALLVDARDGIHKRMKRYTVITPHQAALTAFTDKGELPSFNPVFLALAKTLHPPLARRAAKKYVVDYVSEGVTAKVKVLRSAGLVTTAFLDKVHPRLEPPLGMKTFSTTSGLTSRQRKKRLWAAQRRERLQKQELRRRYVDGSYVYLEVRA